MQLCIEDILRKRVPLFDGVQSLLANRPFAEEFLFEAAPRAAWTVLDATDAQLLLQRRKPLGHGALGDMKLA